MKMTRFFVISLLWALPLFLSCDSKNASSGGGGGSSSWNVTFTGSSPSISIKTQTGVIQGDGGPLLTFTGKAGGKDITITVDIAGGASIVIPADDPATAANEAKAVISVGSSNVNLGMDYDGAHYRGTSGEITFTAYDATSGGKIEGSLDAGLASTAGVSGTTTLNGDFSTTVE